MHQAQARRSIDEQAKSRPQRAPRAVHPAIMDTVGVETLVDALLNRVNDRRLAYAFETLEGSPTEFSGSDLAESSLDAARKLRALGHRPGDAVLLVLPTSPDFVSFFWGTLVAGGVCVPAYPPAGWHQLETFPASLSRMVALSKARHVVVPTPLRDLLMQQTHAGLKNVSILAPEEIWPVKGSDERIPPPVRSEDPAVVQFSSGSTGEPRGICLTHRNILSNVRAFAERMRVQPDDMVVTWLPLYHDMGLIGTMIAPLATGVPLALLPPTDFLRQPSFWLRVMAKYNATISVAPQFAYSLCARKVHTGTLDGVDLSSVRILLNGAEPIQAHAVRRFERTFAPLGMRRNVVTPCYGLGEGTLAVSMVHPRKGLRVETIRPEVGKVPGSHERRRGVPVVSAGPPMSGTEVRVLGPRDSWQPDGRIGEICVRSPSVCRGYLTPEGMIPAVDDRGWLRTGDLGFVLDGEVFVTGRKKDLIIIGGRNLYPQDIEEEAAKINGVRLGRVAAFGIREPKRGTEGLVVLAEANGKDSASPFTANQIRRQILHRFAVSAYDIVLLGRGQIPVTTSGKLRRAQAKQSYLEGQLGEVLYQLHAGGASA